MRSKRDVNTDPLKMSQTGRNVFVLASGLNAVVAVYHFVGGTPEVMYPLYDANLAPQSAGVLDVLWYQMGALIAGAAAAMLVAARRNDWRWPVAWIVGGHYLMISVICLILTFVWFGNAWGLVHWAIFAPLGILAFWAAGRSR